MAQRAQLRNMTFNETFESSVMQKNHQKFTIDRSLAQGIKENDVNKIIDNNGEGDMGDQKELYDEMKEIQGVVIVTRKRYDEIKTSTHRTEQEIDKLKKKKQLLNSDRSKYDEMLAKQKTNLVAVQSRLNEVTDTMVSVVYRKDVYDYIRDCLKKDILVLKKRYFDKDVELMRDKTKLKSLRTEHTNKIKLSKRCREMLDTMQKTVNHKHMQRTSKIHSYHQVLSKKQANQRNKQIREREIQEVMISAMTDKLTEEKEWIKILHANLFLKGLLKNKMENLMELYKPIEMSFHRVKQSTSIKDSNQFIQKFFAKEENYGELLQTISEKEVTLDEIKEEKDELQKNYQNTLYKFETINEENKNKEVNKTNYETVIESQNQRLLKIARQKQLMYGWGTKFLASYNGEKNRDKIAKKFKKTETKEMFLQILNCLKSFIAEMKKQANSQKKIEEAYMKNTLKEYSISEEYFGKNTRIKTMSTYENDGGDPFEDKDMAYDDLSQMDYLQHNRRAVKKNDLQSRRFRIKTKPY